MRTGRKDYNIADLGGKIGINEPVFLIRAQDALAPRTLRFWAQQLRNSGGDQRNADSVELLASEMEQWQIHHAASVKLPDAPKSVRESTLIENEPAKEDTITEGENAAEQLAREQATGQPQPLDDSRTLQDQGKEPEGDPVPLTAEERTPAAQNQAAQAAAPVKLPDVQERPALGGAPEHFPGGGEGFVHAGEDPITTAKPETLPQVFAENAGGVKDIAPATEQPPQEETTTKIQGTSEEVKPAADPVLTATAEASPSNPA
jgi:hypothetical protein